MYTYIYIYIYTHTYVCIYITLMKNVFLFWIVSAVFGLEIVRSDRNGILMPNMY